MSKFLELVEENRPGEDVYTVELRDVNGELMDTFAMIGTGSPFEVFDNFKEEWGSPIPIEDQEGILTDEQKEALELASSMVTGPRGRWFKADPKKKLEKSLGDIYSGVGDKIATIAQGMK